MDITQLLDEKAIYLEKLKIEIYSNNLISNEEKEQRIEILQEKVWKWSEDKFIKKRKKYMDSLIEKLMDDFLKAHSNLQIDETDIKDDGTKIEILNEIMTRRENFDQRIKVIRKDNFNDYAYYINLWRTAYSINDSSQRITNSLKVLDNMIHRSLIPVYIKLSKKNNWVIDENSPEAEVGKRAFRLKAAYFFEYLLKGQKLSMEKKKEITDLEQLRKDLEQLRIDLDLVNDYFSNFRNPVEHGAYRKDNKVLQALESDDKAVNSLENLVFGLLREDFTEISSEYNFDLKAFEDNVLFKHSTRSKNRTARSRFAR